MKTKICLSLVVLALAVVAGISCRSTANTAHAAKPLYYTCPMHPDVKFDHPGDCPVCKMPLIPVYPETSSNQAAAGQMSCCGTPAPATKP